MPKHVDKASVQILELNQSSGKMAGHMQERCFKLEAPKIASVSSQLLLRLEVMS